MIVEISNEVLQALVKTRMVIAIHLWNPGFDKSLLRTVMLKKKSMSHKKRTV